MQPKLINPNFNKALNAVELVLYFTIVLLAFWDVLKAFPLIIIVFTISFLTRPFKSFNKFDVMICLGVLFEFLNYTYAVNQTNSFSYFVKFVCFTLLYFALKEKLRDFFFRRILILIINVCGILLAAVSIVLFFRIYFDGIQLNLQFLPIRYLYAPIGIPINEWVSVFVGLLPFSIIGMLGNRQIRLISAVSLLLSLISILYSFSKGAYLALAAFSITMNLFVYAYHLLPRRKLLFVNVVIFVLIAVSILPLYNTFASMVSVSTTSQKRSIEGRIDIYNNSKNVARDYPLLGVGSNNFALVYNKYNSDENTNAFAGRAFNIFILILIEKGVLGFILYAIIFVLFLTESYKKIKNREQSYIERLVTLAFLSGTISLIVRDLTFSSLFERDVFLLFTCISFSANLSNPIPQKVSSHLSP